MIKILVNLLSTGGGVRGYNLRLNQHLQGGVE